MDADATDGGRRVQRKMSTLFGWNEDALPTREQPGRSFGRESSAAKHRGLQSEREQQRRSKSQTAALDALRFARRLQRREQPRPLPAPTPQGPGGAAGLRVEVQDKAQIRI